MGLKKFESQMIAVELSPEGGLDWYYTQTTKTIESALLINTGVRHKRGVQKAHSQGEASITFGDYF